MHLGILKSCGDSLGRILLFSSFLSERRKMKNDLRKTKTWTVAPHHVDRVFALA
jgi:hypothetical protein